MNRTAQQARLVDPQGRPVSTNGDQARVGWAGERQALQESIAVRRQRFVRRAGLQYGKERDVYTVAGYPEDGELEFKHFWSRYRRQEVAGRIVDMPPQATWRDPPELVEPGMGQDGTDLTRAFAALARRLRLWHLLERADRLARIGRYGVLVIGVREEPDTALASPLPEDLSGPQDILFLSAFHEDDADITRFVADTGDARHGKPSQYRIDLSSGVSNFPDAETLVHHSRVVHIAEDKLADEVHGRPALERVINRLVDLEKITASTAEAYWQLADKILMLSVDPEVNMGEDARDALGEAGQEAMHDLRRQLVGQGIKASWLEGETADPTGPFDMYKTLVAVGGGIPQRILFGSETGERASEQDQRTWMGTIKERESRHAEPGILRPLVDRFIGAGALPEPKSQQGYELVWPNRFQLDEKQQSELSLTRAKTAKALVPVGGDPREMVEVDEDNNVTLRSTEAQEEGAGDPDPDPEDAA